MKNNTKLSKELSLLGVFSITSGTMISSGLFILPGLAYAKAGPAVIVSYLLAGLLTIPGLLSQAELSTAMPKAGGSYYFITRSMGPAVGTIYGIITWFALALKSSFALVGIKVFASLILDCNELMVASSICIIFILINILGIKSAERIQVFLVFTIIFSLILYSIIGITEINPHFLTPFSPHGPESIISTAAFVFISYGGLLKVASLAEEVKNPGKVLPIGMIASLLIVTLIYILVIFVTSGIMEGSQLHNSLTPISNGARALMGEKGYIIISIVAIISFTSASNSGIMAASRYPMALGRDGLMPEILGKTNRKFNTPHLAILVTGAFIILTLLLELDFLVKAASSVVILTYMFSCLSIIILRESRLQNYQPSFNSPLYPWIQLIGILSSGFLLYEIGREAILSSFILVSIGFFVYWFYGRITSEREYALLHLMERITAKELTTHSLETELKEVIRERDDIIKDRFDKIIEQSIILDIEKPISLNDFFKLVSKKMSTHLNVKENTFFKLLKEREKQSSTALTPNLAIPHIIIKGKNDFDILVARSKKGITFSNSAPSVHAIFVLAGTQDERNFHLRSLAAIAQILQDPEFEEKWLNAKNIEGLRDILLLGKRKR